VASDSNVHGSNLQGDHVTACIYFIINTAGAWNAQ
jgi:hypothetical protein